MNPKIARTMEAIAGRVSRSVTRRYVRIFMYHRFGRDGTPRVTTLSEFDQQLRYIKHHFNPCSLSQIVNRFRAGVQPEPGSVVLTVDDGYRDFVQYAYPLLKAHGVHATVYLASEFVSGHCWLWFDALRWLVDNADEGDYKCEVDREALDWKLDGDYSRRQLWLKLCSMLEKRGPEVQMSVLAEVASCFRLRLPGAPTEPFSAMTWGMARSLDASIIEFGAHTSTHPILSRCTVERQKQEIEQSRRVAEQELQREVTAFCYPNGLNEDFTPVTVALVRSAGFTSAVKAYGGFESGESDVFRLNRVGIPADLRMFRNCINGIWHLRDRGT